MLVCLLTVLSAAPRQWPFHVAAHPIQRVAVARRMGDAEVLGTIGTYDANVTEAAKLGTTKAQSREVRDYTKSLLADHQHSQQAGLRLAKLLRIAPVLPADSSIARAHKQEMDQLNLISAAEFDKAFMQYMVADHLMIINSIDKVLLGAASHPQVKAYIRSLRPRLALHKADAQAWLDKQK